VVVLLAVLALMAGAAVAVLALTAAAALGWWLWRYRARLRDDGAPPASWASGIPAPGAPPRRPGGEWISQYLKRISEVE
jgi:hypothetical protein